MLNNRYLVDVVSELPLFIENIKIEPITEADIHWYIGMLMDEEINSYMEYPCIEDLKNEKVYDILRKQIRHRNTNDFICNEIRCIIKIDGDRAGGLTIWFSNSHMEIGYWLVSEYRGKGCMTKIVNAINGLYDSKLSKYSLLKGQRLTINSSNGSSMNVAYKTGYKLKKLVTSKNKAGTNNMVFVRGK